MLETLCNIMNKIYAVCKFYSRIILKKLYVESICDFRRIEKNSKLCIKLKADIVFLTFCLSNELLPKFTNFKLYDVSAIHSIETVQYKKKLLEREISKKKSSRK